MARTWQTFTAVLAIVTTHVVGRAESDDRSSFEVGKVQSGSVVSLTKQNFASAIQDSANPFWLLKFYAPWCGHCKRMAPILDKVAAQLDPGIMAIGTIDCTVHKSLCDDFKVRGYPTMKFSLDGTVHDYPGGRSESDFLSFARKMQRPSVSSIESIPEAFQYAASETDEGVAFVAFHPAIGKIAETAKSEMREFTMDDKLQSSMLTQVYAQVARKEKAGGFFLLLEPYDKSHDASSVNPDLVDHVQMIQGMIDAGQSFVCRLEANIPPECLMRTASQSPLNLEQMHAFVKSSNVATVTKFGPSNFHKVGRKGRPLVVGVIDTKDADQVATIVRELSIYAKTGPEDLRNRYFYGYFDGNQWKRFLEQFQVYPTDMPQIFALDVPSKRYWQNASYKLNVADFVQAIRDGRINVQSAGPKGVKGALHRLQGFVHLYRPWSVVLLVIGLLAVVVAIASWLAPGEGDHIRPPYPRSPSPKAEAPLPPKEEKNESREDSRIDDTKTSEGQAVETKKSK